MVKTAVIVRAAEGLLVCLRPLRSAREWARGEVSRRTADAGLCSHHPHSRRRRTPRRCPHDGFDPYLVVGRGQGHRALVPTRPNRSPPTSLLARDASFRGLATASDHRSGVTAAGPGSRQAHFARWDRHPEPVLHVAASATESGDVSARMLSRRASVHSRPSIPGTYFTRPRPDPSHLQGGDAVRGCPLLVDDYGPALSTGA